MDGIYPVLFNLYLLRLGYGAEYIGLANAMGMLGYALFALPASVVARKIGIRRAMLMGLGMAALSYTIIPLGEFMGAMQNGWILAMRLLATLGTAFYYVTSVPFLIGAASPENRNHAYSIRMAMGTLAGFIGSLIGGLLPQAAASLLALPPDGAASYRYPLMIAGALSSVSILVLLSTSDIQEQTEEPTAITPSPQANKERDRAAIAVIIIMAAIAIIRPAALGVSRTFFNVYLDDGLGVQTAQIGALFAAIQLISLPVTLIMPVLAKRWGNFAVIVASSLGTALSMLPMALIPHWAAATASRLGSYAFSAVSDTALSVYQMEMVPPKWRTTMASATATTFGLAWAGIAYGGGYMITALGYRAVFLLSMAISLVGVGLFWAYFRKPRGEFARADADLACPQEAVS